MGSFTFVSEGPSVEGCKIIDEFEFPNEKIFLLKDERGFFLALDFENLGPFESEKEALLGLARHYLKEKEWVWDKIRSIEKLINS